MENTQNTYLEILRLILKVLKFSTYLAITLLELFIKVSKALLNLTDYEPFKFVKDYKYEVLGKRVENDINLQTIQVATNNMARHQYNFKRSEMFQTQYKNIQEILKICKDEQAPINDDIYKDILYRRGMGFLLDNKIYDNYVREKILSGEADGLMQEYLYNQRKADNGNERGFTIDDY